MIDLSAMSSVMETSTKVEPKPAKPEAPKPSEQEIQSKREAMRAKIQAMPISAIINYINVADNEETLKLLYSYLSDEQKQALDMATEDVEIAVATTEQDEMLGGEYDEVEDDEEEADQTDEDINLDEEEPFEDEIPDEIDEEEIDGEELDGEEDVSDDNFETEIPDDESPDENLDNTNLDDEGLDNSEDDIFANAVPYTGTPENDVFANAVPDTPVYSEPEGVGNEDNFETIPDDEFEDEIIPDDEFDDDFEDNAPIESSSDSEAILDNQNEGTPDDELSDDEFDDDFEDEIPDDEFDDEFEDEEVLDDEFEDEENLDNLSDDLSNTQSVAVNDVAIPEQAQSGTIETPEEIIDEFENEIPDDDFETEIPDDEFEDETEEYQDEDEMLEPDNTAQSVLDNTPAPIDNILPVHEAEIPPEPDVKSNSNTDDFDTQDWDEPSEAEDFDFQDEEDFNNGTAEILPEPQASVQSKQAEPPAQAERVPTKSVPREMGRINPRANENNVARGGGIPVQTNASKPQTNTISPDERGNKARQHGDNRSDTGRIQQNAPSRDSKRVSADFTPQEPFGQCDNLADMGIASLDGDVNSGFAPAGAPDEFISQSGEQVVGVDFNYQDETQDFASPDDNVYSNLEGVENVDNQKLDLDDSLNIPDDFSDFTGNIKGLTPTPKPKTKPVSQVQCKPKASANQQSQVRKPVQNSKLVQTPSQKPASRTKPENISSDKPKGLQPDGVLYEPGWSILTYLAKNKDNKQAKHIDTVRKYYSEKTIRTGELTGLFIIHKGYLRK